MWKILDVVSNHHPYRQDMCFIEQSSSQIETQV